MYFPILLFTIWSLVTLLMIFILLRRGRKALASLPVLDKTTIVFKTRGSGHEASTLKNRLGRGFLSIYITKEALWLYASPFLAAFAAQFDLLHCIPLHAIVDLKQEEKQLIIYCKVENEIKQFILRTREIEALEKCLTSLLVEQQVVDEIKA